MVRGAGRNGVRATAGCFDLLQRLLPAVLETDAEIGTHQPHVGASEPADQDIADLVVYGVGPLDPAFLDEYTPEADVGSDRRDLAGVVGLNAADRHERVTALRQGVCDQVLQLARLVTAVGDSRVAVLPLGPYRCTAQMPG